MTALRRMPFRIALVVTALSASACDRSTPAAKPDSLANASHGAATGDSSAGNGSLWNRAAGPVLLVQGETAEEAIVLLPSDADSVSAFAAMSAPTATATLFGRGGAEMTAHFGSRLVVSESECRVWPLRNVQAEGANGIWSVGFMAPDVAPVTLDSIDLLSSRDSMAIAAEAARLASMVTALTSPSFDGLRFSAHDVRRFEAAPGVQALAAHLTRKVNQEANPQEEQTLLIAERDSGVTSGPYKLVYADRVHGLEEHVATPEVIAAVRIGTRITLVIARDSETGVAYGFLERVDGQWRVRWTSAPTRCG